MQIGGSIASIEGLQMDKIILKHAPNFIKWSIFSILFFVPLFFSPSNSELFELPKMFAVYAAATVIGTSYLLFLLARGKFEISKNPFLLPFLALLASAFISTVFSIDHFTSIFGYQTRLNGGLVSMAAYFTIFAAITTFFTKIDVRKALFFTLGSAVMVSAIGILGHFGRDPLCVVLTNQFTSDCWQSEFRPTLRIFATLGQPNWLATYLIGIIPISIGFFLEAKKILSKAMFLASTAILFATFIFTNSRSGLAGLVAGVVIFIILIWPRLRMYRKQVSIVLVLLTIFTLIFGSFLFSRVREFFAKSTTATQVGGTESGALRLIVWRGALEIWRHYPIIGSGTETFAYSYYQYRPTEHNQTTEWNFLYNKAHNEPLNFLANQGIVGFISYLWVLLAILIYGLRNRSKFTPVDSGLVGGVMAIAMSQVFGFSVVTTNLLTFVLPAFLIVNTLKKDQFTWSFPKNKVFRGAGLIIISGTGFYLLAATYGLFLADQAYERSREYLSLAALGPAQNRIETALTISFPLPPHYLMTKATIEAERAILESESGNASLREQAANDTKKAVELGPRNTGNIRQAATNYFTLSSADPKYLKDAADSAKRVTELAPTDPSAFYNLYSILKADGQKDEALKALDKSLSLKPDYTQAIQAKINETSGIKTLD